MATPAGTGGKTFDALVFDLPGVYQYLGSVAMAVAIQNHTKLYWKEYNDSAVLNGIYKVFSWKGKPGWVEIDQNWEKIRETQKQNWDRYLGSFLAQCAKGAPEAVRYLEIMEEIKASSHEGIEMVFRDARQINAAVIGETTEAIKTLAAIKCGATISLALMSGGLAVVGSGLAVTASGVTLGYKITANVAKTLAEGKQAKIVAIDIGKGTAKEVGEEKVAQPVLEWAVRWMATRPAAFEAAKRLGLHDKSIGAINEYSRQLAKAKAESLKRKLAGRMAERGTQMQANQLRYAAGAARVVPVLFAIKDIVEAVDEYQEDTSQ